MRMICFSLRSQPSFYNLEISDVLLCLLHFLAGLPPNFNQSTSSSDEKKVSDEEATQPMKRPSAKKSEEKKKPKKKEDQSESDGRDHPAPTSPTKNRLLLLRRVQAPVRRSAKRTHSTIFCRDKLCYWTDRHENDRIHDKQENQNNTIRKQEIGTFFL